MASHTWLALFRGINVGGNNLIAMKPLLEAMSAADCKQAQSYIQSGNVVFQHASADKAKISDLLREVVNEHFGFRPNVLVLNAQAFQQAMANNPFSAVQAGKTLHFFFLHTTPLAVDEPKLQTLKLATESFKLVDQVFYLHAPDGIGRSKLAAGAEKALGVPATARNFNTVIKLSTMLSAIEPA